MYFRLEVVSVKHTARKSRNKSGPKPSWSFWLLVLQIGVQPPSCTSVREQWKSSVRGISVGAFAAFRIISESTD